MWTFSWILTWFDLIWPILTYMDLSWPILISLDLSSLILTYFDLFCTYLVPILTNLELSRPKLTPRKTSQPMQDPACSLKPFVMNLVSWISPWKQDFQYQPSGAGCTRSLTARPHCLQSPKWLSGGPKLADCVWKGSILRFFGDPVNFWFIFFLAAMSSSRSDVVTQSVRLFVRLSVRTLFFLLMSLEFYLV